MKKIVLLPLAITLLTSCFGDKKSAIGTDFNDTSFENKKFKGNKIEFTKITEPCNYITKQEIATLYNVSEDKVFLISGDKSCSIKIKMSDKKFDYISGGISFYEDLDSTPDGSSWVERWQIQKEVSKSATWIPNLGQASYFRESKRELFVKFKDYTLSVVAPGSAFNDIEKEKNRDYKKIALAIYNKISVLK